MTPRAILSERGFRSWGMVDGVTDTDCSQYDKAVLGDKAEREARAILAETERDVIAYTEPWGAARDYEERSKYAPWVSPWVALAESLAAFVAEPIQ